MLSAYVDGELSAEQRQRVERYLAEHPQGRKRVEEFRALGDGIAGLARHSLPDDFSQQVLERVEREILSAPLVSTTGASTAPEISASETPTSEISTRGRSMLRSLVWSAAAVAAAVAIMLLGPGVWENNETGDVALNQLKPEGDESARTKTTGPVARDAQIGAPSGDSLAAEHAEESYAVGARRPETNSATAEPTLSTSAYEGSPSPGPAAPVSQPLADAVRPTRAETKNLAKQDASKGQSAGRNGASKGAASTGGGAGAAPQAGRLAARRKLNAGVAGGKSADNLVVVHVQLPAEALRGKRFEKLLARQGIVFEDTDGTPQRPADSSGRYAVTNRRSQLESLDQLPAQALQTMLADGVGPGTQLVLVEAPADQFQATLVELQKNYRVALAPPAGATDELAREVDKFQAKLRSGFSDVEPSATRSRTNRGSAPGAKPLALSEQRDEEKAEAKKKPPAKAEAAKPASPRPPQSPRTATADEPAKVSNSVLPQSRGRALRLHLGGPATRPPVETETAGKSAPSGDQRRGDNKKTDDKKTDAQERQFKAGKDARKEKAAFDDEADRAAVPMVRALIVLHIRLPDPPSAASQKPAESPGESKSPAEKRERD